MNRGAAALGGWLIVVGIASGAPFSGTIRGPRSEPVPDALVRLTSPGRAPETTRTDRSGRFRFDDAASGRAMLRVEAAGYLPDERAVEDTGGSPPIEIVLSPARASAEINVTAARAPRPLADTPASVVVQTSEEVRVTAAPAVDDLLRQAAGFALFRRSGSRTANPTTQGVSLRGVGASGTARAAVLEDGLPLNDPFGGWIFWGRVTSGALERVEIVRGGASDLYGSSALAGVVQLVTRSPGASPGADVDLSAGTEASRDAALFASGRSGDIGAALSAEAYTTGGYVPVAPEERGPVDSAASSRHTGADLRLERSLDGGRIFLRGSLYEESRGNGTPLQTNDVHIGELSAGVEATAGPAALSLRASGTGERFHQTFTSIAAGRSSERLVRLQTVPADAEGVSAQASVPLGAHFLVAGAEARRAQGESREEAPGPSPTFVTAGGRQTTASGFVGDVITAGADWTIAGGVRFDAWADRDGHSNQTSASGGAEVRFADRTETAWSPRLSALFHARPSITVTASAYGAFRAPTLNELYRSFRVGNVATQANPDLRAERLRGAETGIAFEPPDSRWRARANLFWMEVRDAIGNLTLTSTPALITRRRDNFGSTRARGIEIDLEARPAEGWTLTGGYLFSDSTVTGAPPDSALGGLRIPQVPRHQGTLQLSRRGNGWSASVQARGGTAQFEDDQNLLRLRSFFTADAFLSRAFGAVEPYLAFENAFNSRVETGRTPSTTLGAPRTARVGVRLRVGG